MSVCRDPEGKFARCGRRAGARATGAQLLDGVKSLIPVRFRARVTVMADPHVRNGVAVIMSGLDPVDIQSVIAAVTLKYGREYENGRLLFRNAPLSQTGRGARRPAGSYEVVYKSFGGRRFTEMVTSRHKTMPAAQAAGRKLVAELRESGYDDLAETVRVKPVGQRAKADTLIQIGSLKLTKAEAAAAGLLPEQRVDRAARSLDVLRAYGHGDSPEARALARVAAGGKSTGRRIWRGPGDPGEPKGKDEFAVFNRANAAWTVDPAELARSLRWPVKRVQKALDSLREQGFIR